MDLQLNGLGTVLQVAALSIWDNFQERILDKIRFCKVASFRVHYMFFSWKFTENFQNCSKNKIYEKRIKFLALDKLCGTQ